MQELSRLLGADVICRSDCSLEGSVKDVYFDENCRKIVYFVISRAEGDALLPAEAVGALSDAVVLDDTFAFRSPEDADLTPLLHSPIGKKAYTASGKARGEVSDVLVTARGRVRALRLGDEDMPPSAFRAFGDVVILKDASAKKRRTPSVPFPKAETDYPVRIADVATPPPAEEKTTLPLPSPQEGKDRATPPVRTDVGIARDDTAHSVRIPDPSLGMTVLAGGEDFTPYRVIADYNFLLGRTLADDLTSYTGELLAAKGERVTADTVERARRHGKLMDLTLSSR